MTDASVYINYDPFEGDRDADVSLRTVKLVTTRKPQTCMKPEGGVHTLPVGTKARFETALVDSDYWGRYYTCTECIDRWLRDVGFAPQQK